MALQSKLDDKRRFTFWNTQAFSKGVVKRALYDDFMSTTGATSIPIWIKSLGHSEALARAYWERAKGTLLNGKLPLPLKEMIMYHILKQGYFLYLASCHCK
jgi:hypothetical protein